MMMVRSLIGIESLHRNSTILSRNLCLTINGTSNNPNMTLRRHEILDLKNFKKHFKEHNIFENLECLKYSMKNLRNGNVFQYLDMFQELIETNNDMVLLTFDTMNVIFKNIEEQLSTNVCIFEKLAQIFAFAIVFRQEDMIWRNFDLLESFRPFSSETFKFIYQMVINKEMDQNITDDIDQSLIIDVLIELIPMHPKCEYLYPIYINLLDKIDIVYPLDLKSCIKIFKALQSFGYCGFNQSIRKIVFEKRLQGKCDRCSSNLIPLNKFIGNRSNQLELLNYFHQKIANQFDYSEYEFSKRMASLKSKITNECLIVDFANFTNNLDTLQKIIQKYKLKYPKRTILFIIRNYHQNLSKKFVENYEVMLFKIGNLQNDDTYLNYICLMLDNHENNFLTRDAMSDTISDLSNRPKLRDIFREFYAHMSLKYMFDDDNEINIFAQLKTYRSISLSEDKRHLHLQIKDPSMNKSIGVWASGQIEHS